jgi:hypothetical protein
LSRSGGSAYRLPVLRSVRLPAAASFCAAQGRARHAPSGQYVFVVVLVRVAILAAVLSACSGGSDETSPSSSTSSTSATSPSGSTSTTTATRQQGAAVIYGNPANAVAGHLMDGRLFVVRHDPVRRLCLTIGDADFGCADGAPEIAADQDQPTTRFSVETERFCTRVRLSPDNATAVVAVLNDGRRVDDDILSNGAPRVWALPLPPGVNDFASTSIFCVAADGSETPAAKV